MHQFYENTYPHPIETEFYFPIDPQFAMSRILIKYNDGREVEANISEKEEAEIKYADAVAQGLTPVMGTFSKTQGSTMRILLGNFPPFSKAHLIVEFYSHLSIEDLSWCLRLPTTFTPRYLGNLPRFITTGISQLGNKDTGAIQGDKFNAASEFTGMVYQQAKEVGYTWTMSVRIISSGGKLTRVVSLSHPIDVIPSNRGKEALVLISKHKLKE